ncbi:MAG: sugar phosphate nucleotidyltransferase, partial [Candidatus Bathyarchaeia archaeon]
MKQNLHRISHHETVLLEGFEYKLAAKLAVSSLKALILAGGFGTRLRPLSCTRPKILFPIINKPLVEWIIEKLYESNFKEVIFAVNGQTAFHLRQAKFSRNGMRIVYSCDPPRKPLGT